MTITLDPWDPVIQPFLYKHKVWECTKVQPSNLTYFDSDGFLAISDSLPDFSCEFACFDRDFRAQEPDSAIVFESWVPFARKVDPKCRSDAVATRCRDKKYENLHARVTPVPGVRENPQLPSVIIMVLDSVSHSSFIRNMPQTLNVSSCRTL